VPAEQSAVPQPDEQQPAVVPEEQQPAAVVPDEQQPAAVVPDEQSAVPQPDEQQPAAAVGEQQPAAPVPGEQPAVVVPDEQQPAAGQPGEQPVQGSSGESGSVPAAPVPQAPIAAASAVRTDLAARRADVAGRFADSDREWQQAGGTGSAPSVRFDEAMTALGEAGLTPPARAAIEQLFAPRRGSRISRADFDAAVARVQSVADLLAVRPDALTEPSLATRRRGIEETAGAVAAAHADGVTLQGVPLSNAQARELTTEVERMTQAVQRFAAAPPADPVARLLALEGLRDTVARASEVLRSYGPRFEVETGVDELPGRPRAGQPEQARHTRSRQIAERLATADVAAMPVQELLAAMEFSTLEVTATGTVGEPLSRSLPGMGLEQYTLTPDQVRVLKTAPPGLAARIADLLAGYQRSHLIGPGMGDEVFAGLMLAPEGVNQVAQNRGVETFIRSVAEGGVEVELEATAYGRRLAIPLADGGFEYVDVLTGVDYTINLTHERGSARHQVLLDVADPPNGAWRAVHNDVPADAPGGDVLAAGG
jgi:hypothetical protein